MRLSFRLIFALVIVITLVSVLFSYFQFRAQKHSLQQDLQRRAQLLGESLQESIEPVLERRSYRSLPHLVERFGNREHLAGIAIYDQHETPIAITPGLANRFLPASFAPSKIDGNSTGEFRWINSSYVEIYAVALNVDNNYAGTLVIVHDADYINAQSSNFWYRTFLRTTVEVLLISITTLLIIRWSLEGPITRTVQWMRALRTGKASLGRDAPEHDLFTPLKHEVTTLVESLAAARESAEQEARLRQAAESTWTAERLSVHVRSKLGSSRLFVVSNREPYMHAKEGKNLKVQIPASGLVTALEPILRACDGTWIAHGSGEGDRDAVDHNDRLRVPPDDPKYTLRRVWLSKDEEDGYYYGFANEGLWPLCHIAHTRPVFRGSDWEYYQEVNRKFADALLQEMANTDRPVLLLQDYHFALLPKLIKRERPDARVAIFWHIPWPNPEAFGICPWQHELLDGLLGADLVGFHIQSHCDNFLETVNRAVESRVEWEHFAVNRDGHLTVVRPFPISVAMPAEEPPQRIDRSNINAIRHVLLRELGVDGLFLGVGVDRVDYTKGILERFLAIERFLQRYPTYQGKFTFVQIGAPSRTHIRRYQDFLDQVEIEAERINRQFQTDRWRPIVFLKRHHSHLEITQFYRTADLCLVTSLHDGMNLVAKEFVASRDDEDGVLILSRFTGASRELRDALVVNPYDIEEMAEALRLALEMDPKERRARMVHMRQTVKEQNIYRWAGNLIAELCQVRLEAPQEPKKQEKANTPSAA